MERTTERGTRYKVWLSDVTGTPQAGDVITVAPKRESSGADTPDPGHCRDRGRLGRRAPVTVPVGRGGTGLVEPTLAATLTLAPAQIVPPTGLPAGTHALTGPGVTVVNNGATLPEGVSITGEKLVLTVG